MKKSIKFISISLISLMLLLNSMYALAKNNMTLPEYGDSPDYYSVMFKAIDIQKNPETGEITFKNGGSHYAYGRPDTNTYIINDDTDIYPAFDIDMEAFANGSKPWIAIYIAKEDYWEVDGNDNKNIHVAAVIATVIGVIGYPREEEIAAIERVNSLGIMTKDENGNFRIVENVKRSEMAKIIVTMLGLDPSQSEAYFTDVPAGHWAYHYIAKASEMGVINGQGDGTFAPDELITYEDAIKMIVCALGYQAEAEKQGGYPNGYIIVGATLGISNKIAGEPTDFATRGNVAKMINIALDTPHL